MLKRSRELKYPKLLPLEGMARKKVDNPMSRFKVPTNKSIKGIKGLTEGGNRRSHRQVPVPVLVRITAMMTMTTTRWIILQLFQNVLIVTLTNISPVAEVRNHLLQMVEGQRSPLVQLQGQGRVMATLCPHLRDVDHRIEPYKECPR